LPDGTSSFFGANEIAGLHRRPEVSRAVVENLNRKRENFG
jgi:hypothetical protein